MGDPLRAWYEAIAASQAAFEDEGIAFALEEFEWSELRRQPRWLVWTLAGVRYTATRALTRHWTVSDGKLAHVFYSNDDLDGGHMCWGAILRVAVRLDA